MLAGKSILRRVGLSLASAMLLCWVAESHAQVARDKAIRAVLLFHIAQLTQWPTNGLSAEEDTFVIGIVGDDPFGEILNATVKDERVRGRKIKVERYRNADEIARPHLLFICANQSRNLDDILQQVQDRPTLTVADIDRAEQHGVMVHLYWDDNRAKMIINQQAVAHEGFIMSPRLLAVAQKYP